ncbi:MAG: hypothetical protein A3J63_01575 [Candidatus Moranbacteria bacterium RIFCSPHIGHO2_02_FULL_40_12b]|nr:MAG: hypothetical protein A3J63_01575 [Candidatus Moranbacteria bacterium RIFCSPHIGHO2_02_FULL_40_12b]
MNVAHHCLMEKLGEIANLLPAELKSELYATAESLMSIAAGYGAMAGLANKDSKNVLDDSISDLKEFTEFLAQKAKEYRK